MSTIDEAIIDVDDLKRYEKEVQNFTKNIIDSFMRLKPLADTINDFKPSGSPEKDELKDLLAKYKDYDEKRRTVEKQFHDDILALEAQRTKENAILIDKAINEAEAQKKKQLEALDPGITVTNEWITFFSYIEAMSEDAAKNIYMTLRSQVGTLLSEGKISMEKYVELTGKLDSQIKKSEEGGTSNWFKTYSVSGVDGLIAKFKEAGKAMELQGIDTGNLKLQEMGANMFQAAGKASMVVTIIDAIVKGVHQAIQASKAMNDGLNGVFESFGKEIDMGSFHGHLTEFTNLMAGFDEHVYKGWENFKSGNIAGAISETVLSITSLITGINKWHDKDLEYDITQRTKELDEMSYSYQQLQDSINDLYSTEKAGKIEESNENLENQKKLIQDNINDENEKKDADEDRIKDWNRELDEINKQIEANNKAWQEAITGVSFDSFRQSFLNTLLDMNSDAEDFANNFEKYLQNAIIEAMLTKNYNEAIDKLYDDFSDKMKDGLTEEESIELRNAQEQLAQQMLNERDVLAETFGWNSDSDESVGRTASAAKGIAQASQESVDELNGRITAMQSHTFSLIENTKILTDNSALMLERLFNIDVNTARLAYIEKDIHSIGACLNQMSIQGVRIAI